MKTQVCLLPVHFKFSHVINATNYISILWMNHFKHCLPHKQVDPPLLSVNRASTHHCYYCAGVSSPLLPRRPRPGFPIGLSGVHLLMIVPMTWAYQFGFHFQTITGKHYFNNIFSLCFEIQWIEMRSLNQIISNVILKYRVCVLGFGSLLQMFSCLCF